MTPNSAPPLDHSWLRRMAVQIAGTLPEDREAALAILEYARQVVSEFINQEPPPARPVLTVVSRPSDPRREAD